MPAVVIYDFEGKFGNSKPEDFSCHATGRCGPEASNGAKQITYGLYRDAARSLPWGSTTGTNTVAGTGTGVAQALTVYGRVGAQTTPAPATYQDTIVVTITY